MSKRDEEANGMKRYLVKCTGIFMAAMCVSILTSCSQKEAADGERILEMETVITKDITDESTMSGADSENETVEEPLEEVTPPSKKEVEDARGKVFEGMTEEDIERLKENIKIANQRMESAYLNDNIFKKLSDPEHLYWNYFDLKGEIQVGWAYYGSNEERQEILEREELTMDEFYLKYGEPSMDYNRFDADNFVALIEDMMLGIQDETLVKDMEQLIENTKNAKETHEVEYVDRIYKILHDMDYFLFRYGPEDVGKYVKDASLIGKYYGTLTIYRKE